MKRIQRRGRRRGGRKDGRMEFARRGGGGVRVTHARRALSSSGVASRHFGYLDDVGTGFDEWRLFVCVYSMIVKTDLVDLCVYD